MPLGCWAPSGAGRWLNSVTAAHLPARAFDFGQIHKGIRNRQHSQPFRSDFNLHRLRNLYFRELFQLVRAQVIIYCRPCHRKFPTKPKFSKFERIKLGSKNSILNAPTWTSRTQPQICTASASTMRRQKRYNHSSRYNLTQVKHSLSEKITPLQSKPKGLELERSPSGN
jgi:hypothetical protein